MRMALAMLALAALGWSGWTIYYDTFVAKLPLYVGPKLTPGLSVAMPVPFNAPCDIRYAVTACTHYASYAYQRSLTGVKEPEPVFVKIYHGIFASKPVS